MKITTNVGSRGTFNPFVPQTGALSTRYEHINESVVVDVIVNDEHPEYATDGYNIGAIRFRSLKADKHRDTAQLHWALPLETNISEYPLRGEIVLIISSLNRFYYTKIINVTHKVTTHAIDGLNEELNLPESEQKRAKDYRDSQSNVKKEKPKPVQKLGEYFVEPVDVYRLRHDEGDIVFEGRTGQSIRFGSSWLKGTNFKSTKNDQSPNMLLRVGPDKSQKPESEFGLVVEDIDKDASSIWLASDQLVPLTYATKGLDAHGRSFRGIPSRLEGNQIVINSDTVVFNAKRGRMMGFARAGVHLTSGADFSVDVESDHTMFVGQNQTFRVNRRISLLGREIFLGTDEPEQPIPRGADLAKFLRDLIAALVDSPLVMITNGPGSPSALNPEILNKLVQLRGRVEGGKTAPFNSQISFTG